MTGPGRPTLYKPENGELARMFCLLGATNEDLAGLSDVVLRTIDNWIATHASLLCTHQADDQRFGHQAFSGRGAPGGRSQNRIFTGESWPPDPQPQFGVPERHPGQR